MPNLPLSDINVLEFASYAPASFAGVILEDLVPMSFLLINSKELAPMY